MMVAGQLRVTASVAVAMLIVAAITARAPESSASATFVVSGTVTDFGSGLPIAGARVDADQSQNGVTTTDAEGHFTLTLSPSTQAYSITARADQFYVPRPQTVMVTGADVTGVDFALKRDRATIRSPYFQSFEIAASPGATVVVDLAPYITPGTYALPFLEIGKINMAQTPPGGRYVLDHTVQTRAGTVTFDGSSATFTASSWAGSSVVDVIAVDAIGFYGATSMTLTVKAPRPSRACLTAKAALAKARKSGVDAGRVAQAKKAVARACR